MCAIDVAGPDTGSKPIDAVVGSTDGLRLIVKWSDVAHRTKYFFLYAARVFGKPGPDRGLDIESVIAGVAKMRHPTAGYDTRTFRDCQGIIIQNFIAVLGRNEGAKSCP